MNKFLLFSNLAMFVCMAVSFTYGVARFFKKGKALYLQMIVGGLGCMMLGRAFQFVTLLTRGFLPSGFHIGLLGIAGSFVFFLSANYGQMDKLLDDGAKHNRKYRLLGLLAPLLMACIYGLVFLFNTETESMIVYGVMTAIIMFSSYFNLKHFIFPDVEFGIIRSIRGYNLIALFLGVLSVGETILLLWGKLIPLLILHVAICAVSIAIVPILEKGIKKWTI